MGKVYITLTNVLYIAMQCNREEWNGKVRARQSSLWCTCYYLQLFIVKTWLHVFILHVSRIRSWETNTLTSIMQSVYVEFCAFTKSLYLSSSSVSLFLRFAVSLFLCFTKSFYLSCFSDSQQGNEGGLLQLELQTNCLCWQKKKTFIIIILGHR